MSLLGFLAFFLLGAAWSFAAPYDGPPDEQEHVVRAAGVVYGDVMPAPAAEFRGTGTYQHVPKSLVQVRCFQGDPTRPASCATGPGGDRTLVVVGSYTGRYNPVYYAVVGWPLRFWPNWTGLYLARLLTTGICALFWATALAAAVRWNRYRAIVVGAVVGITPVALHLAGSVNPNAVEAAAGALLFAALMPVLVDATGQISRAALWQSGVAAATIGLVRFAGPLWLVGSVAVLLLTAGRQRLRELARSRAVWTWVAAVGAVVLVGGVWTIAEQAYVMAPLPVEHRYTLVQALQQGILGRATVLIYEMVGVAGYLDTPMPILFYAGWFMLAGLLIPSALAFGGWRDRWRVVGMLGVTVGIPVGSETIGVNRYGFGTQGRYLLVTAVGVTILAAYGLVASGVLDDTRLARLTRLVLLIAAPLQLLFLVESMARWQIGLPKFDVRINPFRGVWHPEVGSVLPFVLGVLGLAALVSYGWLATPRVGAPERPDPLDPPEPPAGAAPERPDNTAPERWRRPAITDAIYDRQKRNEGVTEFVELPNRGHSLTIDSGWREVADTALAFVKRFV
jgi:hypothetical protein